MNRTYYTNDWYSIVPADGFFSRNVQKGLVAALQKDLGIAEPTGSVGPQTLASLKAKPAITVGTSDSGSSNLVRLFQAALRFNRYSGSFGGVFSASDSSWFPNFRGL